MRWRIQSLLWCVVATITLMGRVAAAQEDGFGAAGDANDDDGTGPELAVRAGYGLAHGESTQDTPLQERIAGALPIGFDLGYRFHPRWFIGGYGEYALGLNSATTETRCSDCTYTWLHLAIEVQYRVWMGADYDAWVGLGFGRHWFNATLSREAALTRTLSGPEYLNLQFGASWMPSEGIAVGPYSMVSVGSFSEGVERCGEQNLCAFRRRELDMSSVGSHLWFGTGLRVTFLP